MAAITATCASGNLLPLTNTPALTTIFTPPVFCSSRFHIGTSGAPTSYGWQDEVDPVWYSCMPPEWDAAACQSLTFSPALQCPHGWTMDKSKSVLGLNRGLITFATCCMSGFTANVFADGEKCVANVVNFPLVVLATDPSNYGRYVSPLATSVGMTTLESGVIDHRGIVIGWERKDLPAGMTSPPPLPESTGGTSSVQTAPPNRGLSTAAIAGIVVGSVLFIAGIVGSIILWRWKRRRTVEPVESVIGQEQELDADGAPKQELGTETTPEMFSPTEGPSPPPAYANSPVGRHELPVGPDGLTGDVHEMPDR